MAATAFFLFTGRHPTDDDDLASLREALASTPFGAIPEFADALLSGMAKNPDDRPESVAAWSRALAGPGSTTLPPQGPLPPAAPLPPPTPPAPRRRLPLASAIGAVAIIAALTWLLNARFGGSGDPADTEAGPPEETTTTNTNESTTTTTRSRATTSTSRTTTEPPLGPIAEFSGVWHGDSIGADGSVPVVFVLDEATATDSGAPAGTWTYFSCTGPLRLVSATTTVLTVTPVSPNPDDCGFGGQATLTRSGDSAAYDWVSDDGGSDRSGTFIRSSKITTANPGWPTDSNEAGNAFYANLGVCAAGGSGCSRSGQFPSWTACTTDELCIAGGDAPVVDVWRNLSWVLEIPEAVPNTAVALLGVGFSEEQVIDLLNL